MVHQPTGKNPHQSGLLSAESAESEEIVPVVPAVVDAAAPVAAAADPAPAGDLAPAADSESNSEYSSGEVPVAMFKRDVAVASAAAVVGTPAAPLLLVPACPGRVRYFS